MKKRILIPMAAIAVGATTLPLVAMTSCSNNVNHNTLTIKGNDTLLVGEQTDYTVEGKDSVIWNLDSTSANNAYITNTGTLIALKAGTVTIFASVVNSDKTVDYGFKTITISTGTNKVIPSWLLRVDNRVLKGFKGFARDLDLSGFDTMEVSSDVNDIAPSAFWDGSKSLLPATIKHLIIKYKASSNDTTIEGCKVIGDRAFYNSNLETVELPQGIKEIGDFAFGLNGKLKMCNFPIGLNTIGEGAFRDIALLAVIMHERRENEGGGSMVDGKPWMWDNEGKMLKDTQVHYVGPKAFFNCKKLLYLKFTTDPDACPYMDNTFDKSPFACEGSSTPEKSTIKFFDFTNFHRGEVDENFIPNACTVFAKKIKESSNSKQANEDVDFSIALRDFYYTRGDESKQIELMNDIASKFDLGEFTPGGSHPTKFPGGNVGLIYQSNYFHIPTIDGGIGTYEKQGDKWVNKEWSSNSFKFTDVFDRIIQHLDLSIKDDENSSLFELLRSEDGNYKLHLPAGRISVDTEEAIKAITKTVKVVAKYKLDSESPKEFESELQFTFKFVA